MMRVTIAPEFDSSCPPRMRRADVGEADGPMTQQQIASMARQLASEGFGDDHRIAAVLGVAVQDVQRWLSPCQVAGR